MKKIFFTTGFLLSIFLCAQNNDNTVNKNQRQLKDSLATNTYNLNISDTVSEPASLNNIFQYPDGATSWKDISRDQQGNIIYEKELWQNNGKVKWQDYGHWSSREKQGMWNPMPLPYVSEDDVMWAKRITREIDLQDPNNAALKYPLESEYSDHFGVSNSRRFDEVLTGIDARKNFFKVLLDAAYAGQVNVYNERLSRLYSDQEIVGDPTTSGVMTYIYDKPVLINEGEDNQEIITVQELKQVQPRQITSYYIVEDWFFDKRRSKMDVRIVSITVKARVNNKDLIVGTFYYPEVRSLLSNHKIYNTDNMMDRMSFDEFFQRRLFASYIIKESNVYDRNIVQYINGGESDKLYQLWEGERIKENIRSFESSVWEY